MIISKGKKAKQGPVHTRDITLGDVWACFFPKKGWEYSYLGYAWYYVRVGGVISIEDQLLLNFFKEVEKVAKPRWCPRFILRLLYLFGNDNSYVRVRNFKLHRLFNRLTKGISVTDTKWKYESFRIYGNFTNELHDLAEETCKLIEDNYERQTDSI